MDFNQEVNNEVKWIKAQKEKALTKKWIQEPIINKYSSYELKISLGFLTMN